MVYKKQKEKKIASMDLTFNLGQPKFFSLFVRVLVVLKNVFST